MNDRQMPWTRGKILGGCSTVNGMLYVRGNRKNYDDWAASGCDGWSYDDVLPYFKRSECHEDGECEFHGGSGPPPGHAPAGYQPGVRGIRRRDRGGVRRVPRIADFNGASQEGASTFQMTCRDRHAVEHAPSRSFTPPSRGRTCRSCRRPPSPAW